LAHGKLDQFWSKYLAQLQDRDFKGQSSWDPSLPIKSQTSIEYTLKLYCGDTRICQPRRRKRDEDGEEVLQDPADLWNLYWLYQLIFRALFAQNQRFDNLQEACWADQLHKMWKHPVNSLMHKSLIEKAKTASPYPQSASNTLTVQYIRWKRRINHLQRISPQRPWYSFAVAAGRIPQTIDWGIKFF
jgi:hypothetical protein